MDPRFAQLPQSLRSQAVSVRLAGVPALVAHPDEGWVGGAAPTPRPVMIWMHGRTVNKELDPGRYLRWIRAGIAAVALDLPGHGERFEEGMQGSDRTLEIVTRMASELDAVVQSLGEARWQGCFDTLRVGVGGMSAGGMATLIRLCSPHRFTCAAVESTAGDFEMMSRFTAFYTRGGRDPSGSMAFMNNPARRLDAWRPIPLLSLHSEADEWVPVQAMRSFCVSLRERYQALGANPALVELRTWETTGAPNEHAGFGRVASEAKDEQLRFLSAHLLGPPAAASKGAE